MGTTYRPYSPDQDLLLPPSLNEWLPEGHLAYFISDQTTELMQAALRESAEQLRLLESTAQQNSMDDLQERVFASQFLSHDVTAIMTMYAINKFLYANGTVGNSSVLRFKSLLRLAGTMISTTSANRRSHSPMPLIDVYEITNSPHLACQVTISRREGADDFGYWH